jgi:hypothetical protein
MRANIETNKNLKNKYLLEMFSMSLTVNVLEKDQIADSKKN